MSYPLLSPEIALVPSETEERRIARIEIDLSPGTVIDPLTIPPGIIFS